MLAVLSICSISVWGGIHWFVVAKILWSCVWYFFFGGVMSCHVVWLGLSSWLSLSGAFGQFSWQRRSTGFFGGIESSRSVYLLCSRSSHSFVRRRAGSASSAAVGAIQHVPDILRIVWFWVRWMMLLSPI